LKREETVSVERMVEWSAPDGRKAAGSWKGWPPGGAGVGGGRLPRGEAAGTSAAASVQRASSLVACHGSSAPALSMD